MAVLIKSKLIGGFLEQPTRVGAMLDFENVKMEKLKARREKYRDGEFSFREIYQHYFQNELVELQWALYHDNDPKGLLREIADASNCLDMMAWCLIEDGVR